MLFSLINPPFCVKLCTSNGGKESYQVIVAPDKLIIANTRCHEPVKDQLSVYPTLATFFFVESCVGKFVNTLIAIYVKKYDIVDPNHIFSDNVRLRKCHGQIINLEKKNGEEFEKICTFYNKEDIRDLLITIQDLFLYGIFEHPKDHFHVRNMVTSFCEKNNDNFCLFKTSNLSETLDTFDEILSETDKHRLYFKIYHNVDILAIFHAMRHFKSHQKIKKKSISVELKTTSISTQTEGPSINEPSINTTENPLIPTKEVPNIILNNA